MPDPGSAPRPEQGSSSPTGTAVRRGLVPVALGVLCLAASGPAIEDLDPLLTWLGVILLVLGLVIIVATARTLTAARDDARS